MSVFITTPGVVWAILERSLPGFGTSAICLWLTAVETSPYSLRLDERGLIRHRDFTSCFRNFECDVNRNGRSQENIYRYTLFAKTIMGHSQQVPGGRDKEESVHPISIGFRCLGCPFGIVLYLDIGIRDDSVCLIGYDTGQSAGCRGLCVHLAGQTYDY